MPPLVKFMDKLLYEWRPSFTVVVVVYGLLNATSNTNCDVTNCPVAMRRYENADGGEQWYKTLRTQVFLLF